MRGWQKVCVVTVMLVLAVSAVWAAERPTERVKPPPEVNPNAVIWRTPEPPPDAQAGDVWVNPKDGAEMVYVPAGEFIMGRAAERDTNADTDEEPEFRVHLPGYWIDRCEVTVARYGGFCRETGRKMPDPPDWGWHDDHPIIAVTWYDAAAYAEWAGTRLPSELEWEKAARGTGGRIYPWGNDWHASRCAEGSSSRVSTIPFNSSRSGTKPVGSYPSGASPHGCLDMAGNVWEWCADWYDEKANEGYATGDLTPPAGGSVKVVRGGSWATGDPSNLRCAWRNTFAPGTRNATVGFRCARGPG